jgi:integrase
MGAAMIPSVSVYSRGPVWRITPATIRSPNSWRSQRRCRALASPLADRDEFTEPVDYVLANRFGRRLDASALRHRYKRGCAAAGLRPVRLHGLRHAAGSLIARTSDPVFVRDFLGHAKLATTDRYLSAKLRPEELERLDRAFGIEPVVPSEAHRR